MWVTKSLEAISLLIIAGIQVAYRKDLFLEEYPKAFEIALSIFIKQKKKKKNRKMWFTGFNFPKECTIFSV